MGGQPRIWTPVFIAIVIVTLCCFLVGQGLNSGTSVYLSRMGSTATLAGIGAVSFSAAAAVSRIVCGPLADAKGRVIIITAGALVLLGGTLGAALVPDLEFFVLWRVLQGAGFAAATTASATAAADVLPIERLGEGIGYYGLGQAVAMSFGPALALLLVSTDPAENLFWGTSAAAAAALIVSLLCRYEHNPERLPETSSYRQLAAERTRSEHARVQGKPTAGRPGSTSARPESTRTRPDPASTDSKAARTAPDEEAGAPKSGILDGIFEPGALAGALPMMTICPTFGFGIFFAGLLGTSLGIENAGVFYTLSAVVMIAVRLSSKSYMDRVPAIRLHAAAAGAGILMCAVLIAVCQLDLEPMPRTAVFYLAGALYGLCLGISLPVNQAVAVKNSPPERWGAANGLFLLMNDVGIGIAAAVWGIVNDNLGFTVTLAALLVLIASSIAVARAAYPATEL